MRLATVTCAVMLAGCQTTGRAPLNPDPTVDLTGRWKIVAVDGDTTGGGPAFAFTYTPPHGSARFGCNDGNGPTQIDRGWLVTGDWIITVAGCPGRMRFERRGFEKFREPLAIEQMRTGVRLRNRSGSIDLVR